MNKLSTTLLSPREGPVPLDEWLGWSSPPYSWNAVQPWPHALVRGFCLQFWQISAAANRIGSETVRKLKILIVDDSAVMRKIVERALRQAGLEIGEVLEASNGAEALVEVQKGSLDIILSDINMPVMDGLEFLKSLATVEAAKGVPVIMITTEGSEARVVEALSAGAKGYLRKPFTPDQVKERVSPLLVGVS
jgi:two-component system chemotaxis response regulator CheY